MLLTLKTVKERPPQHNFIKTASLSENNTTERTQESNYSRTTMSKPHLKPRIKQGQLGKSLSQKDPQVFCWKTSADA